MTSLEERLLHQVVVDAFNAWRLALMSRAPAGEAIYQLMKTPRVGDLVVEMSTGPSLYQDGELVTRRRHHAIEDQIGRLQVRERRPCVFEGAEPWDVTDGPHPTEEVWVIQRLTDDGEVTWRNADFIRLPEGVM